MKPCSSSALVAACLLLLARLCGSSDTRPEDAPELRLELLPKALAEERGAQCLDHSPAGYYLRKQDPHKWVIFLEGGGLCITAFDCMVRGNTHLGSSKYWDALKPPEGPMSASLNSALNPFANFSQVWVPYCSGDTWLGASKEGHITLFGLQMSGHLILETLVERLLNTTGLGQATDVVLSGSSAGGIGVFHHVDWLSEQLAAHVRAAGKDAASVPRLVGFPIEGVFFPEGFPVTLPQFVAGSRMPVSTFVDEYLGLLQHHWLPAGCVQASQQQHFAMNDCFNVWKAFPYIKTPLFIGMNRFDKLLIQDLGVCLWCDADDSAESRTGRYIRFYGSLTNKTVTGMHQLKPGTGFFVPSAFAHDENFYRFFESQEKTIEGVSLRAAFEAWYWDRRPVQLVESCCEPACGPCSGNGAAKAARRELLGEIWT